ncbi:MAG: hypothetical protein KJN89_09070 [Gammaproteobacteria bacterium]|nr:hypothetical protein [Gammaproteobacteria bacterium]NNJ50514.1 hypothetical protein [Gammaproteobacteria bacterium]
MSTKDTEKTESTPETPKSASNDNKKVFGPLGKYAVVAVIMVSIIVTTAIMLNRQLGTVEEQLAAMESEIAEINDANTNNHESTLASDTAIESTATTEVAQVEAPIVAEAAQVESPVAAEAAELTTVETPAVTEEAIATETTAATDDSAKLAEVADSDVQNTAADATPIEDVKVASSAEVESHAFDMEKIDQERQARIEAFKAEQKQHMTEMFARIKTLEEQRLDEYKTSQDQQIERLREQIARQEEVIEALILRNKEWMDMREARMQESQSKREEMLERI